MQSCGISESLYWSVSNITSKTTMPNSSTFEWLGRLLKDDPECQDREHGSAVRDLIKLVTRGLLVVKCPEDYDKVHKGRRYNCQKLVEELKQIIEKGRENPAYLFSGRKREGVAMPKIAQVGNSIEEDNNQLLTPDVGLSAANVAQRRTPAPWQARPPGSPGAIFDSYMHEFDNNWHYVDDTAFATRVLSLLQADLSQLLPNDGLSVKCDVCQSIDLNKQNSGIDCSLTKPRQSQAFNDCELCGDLSRIAAKASGRDIKEPVSQARKQSITVSTIRPVSDSGLFCLTS
jgi:hypothetical protein